MLVWNFVLLLWKATETINESKYNNDLWKQRVEKIISELCNCRICSFFSEMNPFLSKWESFWEKNTLKIFTKFLVSTATKLWFHYIGSFAEVFEKGLKGILSFIILLFFTLLNILLIDDLLIRRAIFESWWNSNLEQRI